MRNKTKTGVGASSPYFCYDGRMASLIEYKKARLKFAVEEKFEAGIELFGFETKAVKSNLGNLDGSHVTIRGGEAFLVNMTIPAYQPANTPESYVPNRPRKLLLTKKEILLLSQMEQEKGLTIVPLSLYNKGRNVKVEVAVVRGKQKHDKREDIKKRDTERDVRREFKAR